MNPNTKRQPSVLQRKRQGFLYRIAYGIPNNNCMELSPISYEHAKHKAKTRWESYGYNQRIMAQALRESWPDPPNELT